MYQSLTLSYMPGWDCHGLPIEIKAVAEAAADGHESMSPQEIRERARKVALREMRGQRESFKEFGIMTDWSDSNTYRTLNFEYELEQLRLFSKAVEKGLIYERFRPVYWSPSSRTALAEAEIEYDEQHVSQSVYVRFKLVPDEKLKTLLGAYGNSDISLVVWTTTPWSLLGNMAVAIKGDAQYSIVRTPTNELLLVASELVHVLPRILDSTVPEKDTCKIEEVAQVCGADLLASQYRTPLMAAQDLRPILAGHHVTTDSGTGLVHTAPAHGKEDYDLWLETGLLNEYGIVSPVNNEGQLQIDPAWGCTPEVRSHLSELQGLEALGEGTTSIVELMSRHGMLLKVEPYTHSYPIDWRTKKPILMRATAQWFTDLSKTLPDTLSALEQVCFVPSSGKQRLTSLVQRRSEWCISRQRSWGVPIPVVYDAETQEPLMSVRNVEFILEKMRAHGTTDIWWKLPAEEFVAPEFRSKNKTWYIKGDTLDVWYDSGSSWAALQAARGQDRCVPGPCADVYLEGSDQHRGWFQSSLLSRVSVCGTGASAPYGSLITHGFVVDEDGRKMSKSLGNVIAPGAFLHGDPKNPKEFPPLGADVLRWWAAKTDYTKDIPVSTLIMKHVSDEVRKIRNTARFMLANLNEHPRGSLTEFTPCNLGLVR